MKLGLVSVVTTHDPLKLEAHARHITAHFPQWRVVSRCIPGQPLGVYDVATYREAGPKVATVAETLAADGVDAIYVSCAADPGVGEARRRLPGLPILGAAAAGAAVALAYGLPVGLLDLSYEEPRPLVRLLGTAMVADEVPDGVRTALDLRTPEGKTETLAAVERLVARGARLVLYGCTGLSTLGVTRAIRERYGVPVVDPELAAAGLLLTMVRQTG